MKDAWTNVIYTCSNMLIFQNELQVDHWSQKHNIPKGNCQPMAKIWEFSKQWYGDHLNPQWRKWTKAEAKEMFKKYKLSGDVWDLGDSDERF